MYHPAHQWGDPGLPGDRSRQTLYILLAKLTDEGQRRMRRDRDMFLRTTGEVEVSGVQLLGRYAVLGQYDFVLMAEAVDIDSMARLSVELGARLGMHIETLPATSTGVFADEVRDGEREQTTSRGPGDRV